MKPLLELNHVSYAYHSENGETAALSDLSFQVFPGEFIAVIGPSGCGKSTLLSLIASLLLPESGTISYAQEHKRNTSRYNRVRFATTGRRRKRGLLPTQADRSSIGYMLQKDHLFEWRTIYRNILLGLEIQNRLDENALARVDKMLKDYGLEPFRDARPSELSGGMRQRAALIRTLAPNPELLLLDEPFSALDYQTRLAVCDDVAAILRTEKKTALLVTHDLSEAISMADRILVLTKRPARIRTILTIRFARENPDKTLSGMPPFEQKASDKSPSRLTPFERRGEPEFQEYFNYLWKELNADEQTTQ
ncbi:MAG: ATP-binding cassette domain-containing protein [Clostridiales bacterium]|nr:ATP-binding cassette domain-containing protein [Clostridiales bacterium]